LIRFDSFVFASFALHSMLCTQLLYVNVAEPKLNAKRMGKKGAESGKQKTETAFCQRCAFHNSENVAEVKNPGGGRVLEKLLPPGANEAHKLLTHD